MYGNSLNASRIVLNNSMSVENDSWILKNSALYINLTTTPIATENLNYALSSSQKYGYIGLGLGGNSNLNFRNTNPIFSLICTDGFFETGSLIFGLNTSLVSISTTSTTVKSDQNWAMQLNSLTFGNYKFSSNLQPLSVILELQVIVNIVPESILNGIFSQLEPLGATKTVLDQTGANYIVLPGPSLKNTPSLNLSLSDGSTLVLNTRSLFVASNTYRCVSFFFAPPVGWSNNTIILGASTMSYYYTVFQQQNGVNQITFYTLPLSNVSAQQTNTSIDDSNDPVSLEDSDKSDSSDENPSNASSTTNNNSNKTVSSTSSNSSNTTSSQAPSDNSSHTTTSDTSTNSSNTTSSGTSGTSTSNNNTTSNNQANPLTNANQTISDSNSQASNNPQTTQSNTPTPITDTNTPKNDQDVDTTSTADESASPLVPIVVGVVVIVALCAGIWFLGVKKGWFKTNINNNKDAQKI